MILQALKEYYDRKIEDPESDIAPEGFEKKELQFLIVINEKGEFISIEDTREKVGSKLVAKTFLLPRSVGRSGSRSYETTFLLWDHIGYLLGQPISDRKSIKQHQTWLKALNNLPLELAEDSGVRAVIRFYEQDEVAKAIASSEASECFKAPQCNMSFRLVGDVPVPCRERVQAFVINSLRTPDVEEVTEAGESDKLGICLVTGEWGEIARTHGRTPINKDTKCLVGFQKNSGYDSYGKEQGYNAPVVKSTEFSYVTALNTLLKSKTQRILVGDASTVFWSQSGSSFESDFSLFFSEPERDNPDSGNQKVKELFESVNSGTYMEDDGDDQFYVLGLSPNSARIAIRFWQVGTISQLALRIKQYFDDFAIVKPPKEPEFYSIRRILVNISTQDKSENILPNLTGDMMRSILSGTPYPATLLQAALRRIRSDTKERVKPVRAALIKAYLNRFNRFHPSDTFKEVSELLDVNQPSVGYQLGRLFATLEKIQEEASPGINATIKERFYGAACATPVTVFPNLLRLKVHHIAKLDHKGRVVEFERLLGEIMGNLKDFPSHLDIHQQGLFAIGYYHQRQAFFQTKNRIENDLNQ
ncbi:type I-C CRISPR-associated protein Cas8c/Csd1 [Ferroacidibacillus organovorans]|uniref:Type I-C CRISPR-associated protein Cas8c/Csd1 n=1 Tax=Ferroacidibacillus organovorans TaxID=1765683 RepID=A0A101XS23_9BACL|nr:type I-C CRISPR-associated protein Cas8c/Csd1 [Ferroacidibacillus organovorans]KUO96480.1 type I-C CRISPR-associated protein Cas8c/Csd1 [Ferroacidibacillus organovorans]